MNPQTDLLPGPTARSAGGAVPLANVISAIRKPDPQMRMSIFRRHVDLLLLSAIGVLLVAFPQLDLAVTGIFYTAETGFYMRDLFWVRSIHDFVPWFSRAIIAGLLLFLLAAWTILRKRNFFLRRRHAALYLLLVALLGPLLLVNGVFKEHWGRARPSQVVEFGGAKQFTRAAVPADQCEKNCSFVSGHAAAGFYILALAFVLPRRRKFWFVLGTGLGLGIGFVRVVQGGHFFSDVIFCGIVVYLTARVLHAVMFRHDQDEITSRDLPCDADHAAAYSRANG